MKLILSSVLIAAAFAQAVIGQDVGCHTFVLDDCPYSGVCEVKRADEIVTEAACQFICQEIQPDFCQSWAYSNNDKVCFTINCPMNYWQDSCKFVGGHTKPKLDQCTPVASEGCDGFRKSDCQPKDEPFSENIADDAAKCQLFCESSELLGLGPCGFWTFDQLQDFTCRLYRSDEIECRVLAGPIYPDFEECFGQPTEPALVTAKTVNATSNLAVSGVDLSFKVYTPEGDLSQEGQGVSDGEGLYEIGRFDPGTQVDIQANAEEFEPSSKSVSVGTENVTVLIPMIPKKEEDENATNYIVMSWGAEPQDLDLHMVEIDPDTAQPVCHVFYGQRECGEHYLDVDNTSGGDNGAETITMNDNGMGNVYMIYVFDYNPNANFPMTTSGATVILSELDSTTVAIPTDGSASDRYWLVGCFLGEDMLGTFIEINELSAVDVAQDLGRCTDLFP